MEQEIAHTEESSRQLSPTSRERLAAFVTRYYTQLTSGCGSVNCVNSDCASHPDKEPLSANEAFLRSVELATAHGEDMLCPVTEFVLPSLGEQEGGDMIEVTSGSAVDSSNSTVDTPSDTPVAMEIDTESAPPISEASDQNSGLEPRVVDVGMVTDTQPSRKYGTYAIQTEDLHRVLSNASSVGIYDELELRVKRAFLSPEHLRGGFILPGATPSDDDPAIDWRGLRLLYGPTMDPLDAVSGGGAEEEKEAAEGGEGSYSVDALAAAREGCAEGVRLLTRQLHYTNQLYAAGCADLRYLPIVFAHPMLLDPECSTEVLAPLLAALVDLPPPAQKTLSRWWSRASASVLSATLSVVSQFLTLHVLQCAMTAEEEAEEEEEQQLPPLLDLPSLHAAGVMKLLYDANLESKVLPYTAFYSDALNSESVSVGMEFHRWRVRAEVGPFEAARHGLGGDSFDFSSLSFLLDPAAKSRLLRADAQLQMQREYRAALVQYVVSGQRESPFFLLQVRRSDIIRDTMEKLAALRPAQLKKPMKVKFEGEEGVDEGGVRKEFFQVILRQLLDPQYAMFLSDEESRLLWFNGESMEATMEFELVGMLLGLAIYNSIIVDLPLAPVVYKKLLDESVGLDDLRVSHPALARGLQALLDYDGDVTAIGTCFQYSYELFGEMKTVDLCEGGADRAVDNDNREEYVSLYCEYVLGVAVARPWGAFVKGFKAVCGGEVLQMFRSAELELLVCGSPVLDFHALQASARYQDGFTKDSPVVRYFWETVHAFGEDDKKKLLAFATGSDRAPINGLAALSLVISRNGPDGDRLPTSHTCFNHLLLPEYSTKEKLAERLQLAINQAEGFGLL